MLQPVEMKIDAKTSAGIVRDRTIFATIVLNDIEKSTVRIVQTFLHHPMKVRQRRCYEQLS
jgi:hypothetical protein